MTPHLLPTEPPNMRPFRSFFPSILTKRLKSIKPTSLQPTQPTTIAPSKSHLGSTTKFLLLLFTALLTSLYSIAFLTRLIPADPTAVARILGSKTGTAHILTSLIAMTIGPFQFLPSLRQNYPTLHRVTGWVYTIANVAGGLSAFYISFQSGAYIWGRVGFAVLALSWLETLRRGISAAVQGKLGRHRRWMVRNFALTYAAVELRWMLPVLLVGGMDIKLALSIVAWSCWVPNLVVVERRIV